MGYRLAHWSIEKLFGNFSSVLEFFATPDLIVNWIWLMMQYKTSNYPTNVFRARNATKSQRFTARIFLIESCVIYYWSDDVSFFQQQPRLTPWACGPNYCYKCSHPRFLTAMSFLPDLPFEYIFIKLSNRFFETLLKNRDCVIALNRRVECVIVYIALKMKSLTVLLGSDVLPLNKNVFFVIFRDKKSLHSVLFQLFV